MRHRCAPVLHAHDDPRGVQNAILSVREARGGLRVGQGQNMNVPGIAPIGSGVLWGGAHEPE